MPSTKYLAKFSDDDVYTMLYLYYCKGASFESLEQRFSIGKEALEGFLEGRYRHECYKNFKIVEKLVQDRE